MPGVPGRSNIATAAMPEVVSQQPLDNQTYTAPFPEPVRVHRCGVCQRTYERADHLSRHIKSHENARPFRCQLCGKSFNRADLLHRHITIHARDDRAGGRRKAIRRTERAAQACVACAVAKVRCDDQKPCRRCLSKSVACEAAAQSSSSKAPNNSTTYPAFSANGDRASFLDQPALPPTTRGNHDVSTVRLSSIPSSPSTNIASDTSSPGTAPQLQELVPSRNPYATNPLWPETDQIRSSNAVDEMLLFISPADFNNQSLDFGFQDFDFNEFDFQNQILTTLPDTPRSNNIYAAENREGTKSTSRVARNASRGFEAFQRSPWLWTPSQGDHVLRDQRDLEVDGESISSALSPAFNSRRVQSEGCVFPPISTNLRDRMFYLVSATNKYANGSISFPSLDILNNVIEAFFTRQNHQIDTWIHVPTISLKTVCPEFLIALVMGGSAVISIPSIWKMGLVLFDVIRVTVGDLVSSPS